MHTPTLREAVDGLPARHATYLERERLSHADPVLVLGALCDDLSRLRHMVSAMHHLGTSTEMIGPEQIAFWIVYLEEQLALHAELLNAAHRELGQRRTP